MIHLNGHPLCVVDTETTGTRPGYHEIIQLTALPVDNNLKIPDNVAPFDMYIRPENPNRMEPEALRKFGKDNWNNVMQHGMPGEKVHDLFYEWAFNKLGVQEGKRITPMAHNWPFDAGFLKEFFGFEPFNAFFDSRVRDTMSVACFMNDQADFDGENIPFPENLRLSHLARKLGIEVDKDMLHNSLYDCQITLEVYKAMIKEPRL